MMHGPVVVSWSLAALALGTGGYCLRGLRTARDCAAAPGHGPGREADGAEALMGLAMAGTALMPGMVWGLLSAVLAGVLLLGAIGRGRPALRTHRLHHGIGALTMTYMALAMAATPGHAHHAHHAAPAGMPLLTGLLLLYFGGYALWGGSRLLGTAAGPVRTAGSGLAQACRVAMGIGMFAMLLAM